MKSLLTWPLRHRQVAIVLSVIALGLGLHSLLTMPREDTPRITVHQALVIALYPGANAAQVEQQLTRPIEAYLFTFTEVNPVKTHSTTRDGQAVVTVELHEWVKDKEGFWSRLRLGLAELKQLQLPAGTLGPLVNSDFGESVALLIGVTSPHSTYAELRRNLERIEDALRTVKGAGRIKRYGERHETIYVEADSHRIARYGAGLPEVVAALRQQNATPYSGTIKAGALEVPLHTRGRFTSVEEVRQQVVFTNPVTGVVVRIGDVAAVERRLADAESILRLNGRDDPVLILSVEMQPGHNIVKFGREVQAALDGVKALLPADVALQVINDQPGVVALAVNHFIREFFIALVAVVAVTLLLLPWRVASIAALAIPVTIAITFKVLEMLGVELHEVSLAALIVVLGMVVDDAIVIADNYVEKLDHGLSRWDAAWRAAHELAIPVFTATIAIILAFAPLAFFLTGSTGEFILALPITVGIALATSFFVAMFLTPMLCYVFIHQGLKEQGGGVGHALLGRVQGVYARVLGPIVRHPWLAILAGVLSLPAGAALLPFIKQKFFPAAERAQFVIEIDLPLGTRLETTDAVARRVEAALAGDARLSGHATFVGTAAPRVYYSFAPEFPRASYAMLLVNTQGNAETDAAVADYARRLAGLDPAARINVARFQQGVPTEAPVEVRISGPELGTLRRLGDEVRAIFLRAPGAEQVRDDFRDGFSLDLRVNSEVANRLGLSTSVIAAEVMAGFRGVPVTELWEHDAPVPIVMRLEGERRHEFTELETFMLRAPLTQATVPLNQVAEVQPDWSPAQIARRNGVRTLTVFAHPAQDVLPSQVLAPIRAGLEQLRLPPGYRIELGGEYEGQQETFGQMSGALVASVVLIYLVLLFQFKSSRETLIVMLAIPLTFFGAMAGLVLTRNPLGFTATVGLISLVGIVIRNSIILVDYADELRRHEGLPAGEAVVKAGERRLRPIFLTSMAAAVGVLPMILSGSPLWAPLASVFSVGIVWSMLMTLLVIPAVYALMMQKPPPNARPVGQEES